MIKLTYPKPQQQNVTSNSHWAHWVAYSLLRVARPQAPAKETLVDDKLSILAVVVSV